MPTINFPSGPSTNDTYNLGLRTWKWNGEAWALQPLTGGFTGSQGAIGYTGSAGSDGSAGSSGAIGYTGSSGADGSGIDWQSSIKTSSFTAVAGQGYWINTTSNTVTITLPGSASVGDTIEFVDYARKFGTNKIIVNTNSLNFQGGTENAEYSTNGVAVRIVYSGATKGWIPTTDESVSDEQLPDGTSVDFLVIAGGGGSSRDLGGGAGAGGYRNSFNSETSGGGVSSESALLFISGTTYTISVGAGGAEVGSGASNDGSNSSIVGNDITNIVSIGGGGGGSRETMNGRDGGSGGGSPYNIHLEGGDGTTGQGFDGGGGANNNSPAAGGGGASEVGGDNGNGIGGDGLASAITGSNITRAGGGGGGGTNNAGAGGAGGGGAGGNSVDGVHGTVNTGGGAGGGGNNSSNGAAGGSGVVILRMPTTDYSGTYTGGPTVSTSGTNTILIFNGDGSYTH